MENSFFPIIFTDKYLKFKEIEYFIILSLKCDQFYFM